MCEATLTNSFSHLWMSKRIVIESLALTMEVILVHVKCSAELTVVMLVLQLQQVFFLNCCTSCAEASVPYCTCVVYHQSDAFHHLLFSTFNSACTCIFWWGLCDRRLLLFVLCVLFIFFNQWLSLLLVGIILGSQRQIFWMIACLKYFMQGR